MIKNKPYALLIGFLPIQILFFALICQHTEWIENYYIPYIFKPLTEFLRYLIGGIDFSIGLFLNNIGIVILLTLIIYKIIKRTFFTKKLLLQSLSFISVLYFFYMIFWGLAYYRMPIDKLLNLNKKDISYPELLSLSQQLVLKTNEYRDTFLNEDFGESNFENGKLESIKNYKALYKLNPLFQYKYPSIKPAVMSDLMSSFGTAGLYYFFSGEANINKNLHEFESPFVRNHEIAHQLGFASEEEANFVSFLSCRTSKDPIVKYAMASEITVHALSALARKDSAMANKLMKTLSPSVQADYKNIQQRWKKFQNPFEKYVVRNFYDIFLKSNGQEQGSQSYGLVVELLVAEMRKNNGILPL